VIRIKKLLWNLPDVTSDARQRKHVAAHRSAQNTTSRSILEAESLSVHWYRDNRISSEFAEHRHKKEVQGKHRTNYSETFVEIHLKSGGDLTLYWSVGDLRQRHLFISAWAQPHASALRKEQWLGAGNLTRLASLKLIRENDPSSRWWSVLMLYNSMQFAYRYTWNREIIVNSQKLVKRRWILTDLLRLYVGGSHVLLRLRTSYGTLRWRYWKNDRIETIGPSQPVTPDTHSHLISFLPSL